MSNRINKNSAKKSIIVFAGCNKQHLEQQQNKNEISSMVDGKWSQTKPKA